MILFCEDCSSKNSIPDQQVKDSTIVFRCSSCGYLNTMGTGRLNLPSLSVADVEGIMSETDGVTGFCILDVQKGLLSNHMPAVLTSDDVLAVSRLLLGNYQVCSYNYEDITRMTVVISGQNFVFQMLTPELALVLACRRFPLQPEVDQVLDRIAQIRMR